MTAMSTRENPHMPQPENKREEEGETGKFLKTFSRSRVSQYCCYLEILEGGEQSNSRLPGAGLKPR